MVSVNLNSSLNRIIKSFYKENNSATSGEDVENGQKVVFLNSKHIRSIQKIALVWNFTCMTAMPLSKIFLCGLSERVVPLSINIPLSTVRTGRLMW